MSFDLKISNGDLSIGPNGDLQKVENTDKLIQDILKISTTPIGSNQFYPFYGSPVAKSMVGASVDIEMSLNISSNQLSNSISVLQKMQNEQAKYQRVTPAEQIAAIQTVQIQRNQTDPRFFNVIIRVLTRALTQADTSFFINGL